MAKEKTVTSKTHIMRSCPYCRANYWRLKTTALLAKVKPFLECYACKSVFEREKECMPYNPSRYGAQTPPKPRFHKSDPFRRWRGLKAPVSQ